MSKKGGKSKVHPEPKNRKPAKPGSSKRGSTHNEHPHHGRDSHDEHDHHQHHHDEHHHDEHHHDEHHHDEHHHDEHHHDEHHHDQHHHDEHHHDEHHHDQNAHGHHHSPSDTDDNHSPGPHHHQNEEKQRSRRQKGPKLTADHGHEHETRPRKKRSIPASHKLESTTETPKKAHSLDAGKPQQHHDPPSEIPIQKKKKTKKKKDKTSAPPTTAISSTSVVTASTKQIDPVPVPPHSDQVWKKMPELDDTLTRITEAFIELNKIPNMKQFLAANQSIEEQFRNHPDIAMAVAKDEARARRIMEQPLMLQQMIDLKMSQMILSDPLPHRQSPTPSNLTKDHYYYQNEAVEGLLQKNKSKASAGVSVGTETLAETEVSEASVWTKTVTPFPERNSEIPVSAMDELAASSRMFLAHHVESKSRCCGKRKEFYDIMDSSGKPFCRCYQGEISNTLAVREIDGSEIIVIQKNFSLCKKSFDIFYPPGAYLGSVVKTSGFGAKLMFDIVNESKEVIFTVHAKKISDSEKYRSVFELYSPNDDNPRGTITAEWPDLPKLSFWSNIVYGISFPLELDNDLKILVMAAWFLVYKLFYEGSLRKNFIMEDLKKAAKLKKARKPVPIPTPGDATDDQAPRTSEDISHPGPHNPEHPKRTSPTPS